MKHVVPGQVMAAAALVLLVSASPPSRAAPASQAPAIATDEIYLDLQTRRFQGPIATPDANKPVKIAVHASPGSHVVLAYWPRPSSSPCPTTGEPPAKGVAYRAGAPGEVAGDKQKYVVAVGPLDITRAYCFHATVSTTAALTQDEQERVDAAMVAALEDLLSPVPGPRCAVPTVPTPAGAAISASQLSAAFESYLPWHDTVQVELVGNSSAVTIGEAFEQLVASDRDMRRHLQQALQHAYTEARSKCSFQRWVRTFRDDTADEWGDAERAVYDPLWFIEDPGAVESKSGRTRSFAQLIRRPELRGRFAAVLGDKEQLAALVWRERDRLKRTKGTDRVRAPLRDDLEALLLELLQRPTAPPEIEVRRDDLLAFYDQLALERDPLALKKQIATFRASLPGDPKALASLPGFDRAARRQHPAHELLYRAVARPDTLARTVDGWLDAAADKEAFIHSSGYQTLRARMKRLSTWQPGTGAMQYAPTYVQRFPLSVSADVGVGGAAFDSGGSRRDAFSYVGLAFYFAPVYKEQPLQGTDWWRRLSLNAGITIHTPTLDNDAGVEGLLGDRMLLAGLGLRLSDYVRLSTGALLYKQTSPNPLSSQKHTRAALYTALSLDLDVIGKVAGWYANAAKSLR